MILPASRPSLPVAVAVAALAAALAPAPARAQDTGDGETTTYELPPLPGDTPPPQRTSIFTLTGAPSVDFQLSGGEFDVMRIAVGVGVRIDLGREASLTFQAGYELNEYDFENDAGLGFANPGKPWDDINIVRALVNLHVDVTDELSFFGGPVFEIASEDSIDIESDSMNYGGFFGGQYRVDDGLLVGFGVGVITQLQDDARVFPILVLDWEITNEMHLRSMSAASAGGVNGVELVYRLTKKTEVGIGAGFTFRRFRLDDDVDGDAPEGVGEETSLPILVRIIHNVGPNVQVTARAGVAMAGELKLEQANGVREHESYDQAGLIGVSVSVRF